MQARGIMKTSETKNREKEQAGSSPAPSPEKPVRGFKMKPQRHAAEKTTLSSSGLEWTILTAVILKLI